MILYSILIGLIFCISPLWKLYYHAFNLYMRLVEGQLGQTKYVYSQEY